MPGHCRGIFGVYGGRDEKRKEYSIGDLAEEFGTTPRALRFYEQNGLVTPRREGGTRFYSDDDRRRIKFITFGRRMNLAVCDIKELLDRFDRHRDHRVPIQYTIEKLMQHLQILHDEREHIEWAIARLSRCIPKLQQKIV